MKKCKVLVRPTGAYNGEAWPAVGETIDLPDSVAEGMARSGNVEIVKESAPDKPAEGAAESRPAPKKSTESRSSGKSS